MHFLRLRGSAWSSGLPYLSSSLLKSVYVDVNILYLITFLFQSGTSMKLLYHSGGCLLPFPRWYTYHDESPCLYFKCGETSLETSTIYICLMCLAKAAATTASFSIGLNEHVEYTNLPPFFSILNPLSRISSWSSWLTCPIWAWNVFQSPEFFLKVPSISKHLCLVSQRLS